MMTEDAMSAKERLQVLQAALVERGVRDVKFLFSLDAYTSVNKVASDVADVLEAVQQGRFTPHVEPEVQIRR